jgi:hypothetical protein
MRRLMRRMRAIGERRWAALAVTFQPFVADTLADANHPTDVANTFAGAAVYDGLDELQSLGHERIRCPGHRVPPRGTRKVHPGLTNPPGLLLTNHPGSYNGEFRRLTPPSTG